MSEEDIQHLRSPRLKVRAADRFRDSHHMVARLFASGLNGKAVAEQAGYSQARIYQLEVDPAFQELIARYRLMVDQSFVENVDQYVSLATANMLKAERQISDKLDAADEEGETLPVRELVSISRDAADRFGYGKHNTQVNVNLDFAARLEAAIKRSSKVIESVASPSPPPPRLTAGGMVETPLPSLTPPQAEPSSLGLGAPPSPESLSSSAKLEPQPLRASGERSEADVSPTPPRLPPSTELIRRRA